MRRPIILVISSPSGGGKTTIARRLVDFGFVHITTATTRKRRRNERDGIDYHFVDEETFKRWISEGRLFEWAKIYGNYYGVPKDSLYNALRSGKNAVLTLDVNGKRSLEKVFKNDRNYKFRSVFLMPPSIEELRRRLLRRGDSYDTVERRIKEAEKEIKNSSEYDLVVINDRIDRAVKRILCWIL